MAKAMKHKGRKASGSKSERVSRSISKASKKVKETRLSGATQKRLRPLQVAQETAGPDLIKAPRSVRIFLEESPPPNEDPMEPIIVDLFLSEQHRQCGKWFIFGWIGNPKDMHNSSYPFIIRHTGQIDFGSEWDDTARFGHTDLLDGAISNGRRVQFDLADWGEFTYRITRIQGLADLAELAGTAEPKNAGRGELARTA